MLSGHYLISLRIVSEAKAIVAAWFTAVEIDRRLKVYDSIGVISCHSITFGKIKIVIVPLRGDRHGFEIKWDRLRI